MKIQEAAERTGLSAHAIRFYEKQGLLPDIQRTNSGIREFTESNITFLQFVSSLRKTGMSLQDIAEYIQDGCILERLTAKQLPAEPVNRRVSILEQHRENLLAQRLEIEALIDAVDQKLAFYNAYLAEQQKEKPVDRKGILL